ncbi:peptidoglycan-binding protein (plasmid) [Paracoccus liaowanqingii]|uniref:Peptidoglycan-binding protein n=1 Tax=Paracoccus liaowanqingii TaxID=2560053 RepID=A0A4Y5SRV8_9RHOB|nr:peptidoglycan-binding protein [Paracoccus liaowanqingii]QDA36201.1 peptidoglycan-binding protein [Paracoccus liaowanqingii]
MKRLCLPLMIASAIVFTSHMARADPDLGEMVGTIARTLLEQQQVAQEGALWKGVVENGSAAAYRQYLNTYPDGAHARDARQRLSNLEAGTSTGSNAARAEAQLGLTQANRMIIQRRLAALGHYRSGIDGDFGAGTRQAIAGWQKSRRLSVTGYLNANQSRVLLEGGRTPEAPTAGLNNSASSAAQVELELGLTRNQRVQIQRDLMTLGYDPKGVDGLFGAGTREAIQLWQRSGGESVTGYVTASQIRSLQTAAAARDTGATSSRAAAIDEQLLGLTPTERVEIQQQLVRLGYLTGRLDGVFGSASRKAIGRWQGDNGMAESGYLTAEQVRTLQRQGRV